MSGEANGLGAAWAEAKRHGDQGAELAGAPDPLGRLRTLGAQVCPHAISVACPPRQTRTAPVEPAVTAISP